MLRFYISGRVVPIPGADHFEGMTVSRDVPQGSILSLALWNVYYGGLMSVPDRVQLIRSIDNVALIITKHTTKEIECMAGATLEAVARWMVYHRLKLAANKIEVAMHKIVKEPRCLYYQEAQGDAEHSLFKCQYFKKLKEGIASLLERRPKEKT